MKRFICIILTAIVTVSLCLCFSADSLPRVIDEADLFTQEEESILAEKVDALREQYSFDVVLLTVGSLDGKTAMEYADDYFDYNGYGLGESRDGMLFLVNVGSYEGDRDYWTSTRGSGIVYFTDYGIERLGDKTVDYLSDGEYFTAFDTYLDLVGEFLREGTENKPYDITHPYTDMTDKLTYLLVAIVISFIVSLIIAFIIKATMNNARPQKYAAAYIRQGSFNLRNQRDLYLYTTTVRRKIESESSSGGSSTHTSSSGASHGGGGGKF